MFKFFFIKKWKKFKLVFWRFRLPSSDCQVRLISFDQSKLLFLRQRIRSDNDDDDDDNVNNDDNDIDDNDNNNITGDDCSSTNNYQDDNNNDNKS